MKTESVVRKRDKKASTPPVVESPEEKQKKWSGVSWKTHCLITIIGLIIMFSGLLWYLPAKINPIAYHLPPLIELTGPLEINKNLRGEKLFENKVRGAESIAIDGNVMYSVLHDRRIVKIEGQHISTVTLLGDPACKTVMECGRGLGIRLDKTKKFLYVVDAYNGLFKVTLDTGSMVKIFPTDSSFKVTFFDDVALLPDNKFLITEASVKFSYHEIVHYFMEGTASGRLLLVDANTGQYEELASNIAMANGVQVHSDGVSALVAETCRLKILRVFFTGPRKGHQEVFTVLPGFPDNIRPATGELGRTGYWVGMAMVCHSGAFCPADLLSTWPTVRSVFMKLIPVPILHMMVTTKHSMAIRIDENGRIVESLQDTEGVFVSNSEIAQVGDTLYLGSYYLPFIGKVKLQPL